MAWILFPHGISNFMDEKNGERSEEDRREREKREMCNERKIARGGFWFDQEIDAFQIFLWFEIISLWFISFLVGKSIQLQVSNKFCPTYLKPVHACLAVFKSTYLINSTSGLIMFRIRLSLCWWYANFLINVSSNFRSTSSNWFFFYGKQRR